MSVSLTGPNGVDDTAAWREAIAAAVDEGPAYEAGPSGEPQALLTVGPGRWRATGIVVPSNLRIELDAGVTPQLPAGTGYRTGPGGTWGRGAVFLLGADGNRPAEVHNVSIVPTGQDLSAPKRRYLAADPVCALVDVQRAATFQLDPEITEATNTAIAFDLCNVTDYEIGAFLYVQNDTDWADADPDRPPDVWPCSWTAAVAVRAAKSSPVGPRAGYLHPRRGRIAGMACIGAPRGFGPVQFNSCDVLEVGPIVTVGGTGARVETDGGLVNLNTGGMDRGAIVDGLHITHAVGVDCNRPASFTPHSQANGSVVVDHLIGRRPFQGVVFSRSNRQGGSFASVKIGSFDVLGGDGAQLPSSTALWERGTSQDVYSRDGGLTWWANVTMPDRALQTVAGTWTGRTAPY